MRKTTLREIRSMIATGKAIDITTINNDEEWALRLKEGRFDTLAMSFGVYGMTGAILQGENTGTLYAIKARNANLFRMV